MTDDLETHAVNEAATAAMEMLERDVRGAWMAGYDYLHVYEPVVTERDDDDLGGVFRIGYHSIPNNSAKAPRSPDYSYSRTYDLTDLQPEDLP